MKVRLTIKEAILIDYVLTLHQFDEELLERLINRYIWIRDANAQVLCGLVDILETEKMQEVWDEVIAMIPPIFVIGGEEIGFTLKRKLYNARYGWENEDAGKDSPKDKTENNAETTN